MATIEPILEFIEERLRRKHKPDPELVKKHNADSLNKEWQIPEGALWEQSDVVHDFLAFLAEQMIEMNKQKQSLTKSFLGWLESELNVQQDSKGRAGIEALTGKDRIKNYIGDYQKDQPELPFEEFWQILLKNKNRISKVLSPSFRSDVEKYYSESLSKLLPLKSRLAKTDTLIDQIVYKLYGLTEDEIQIIEQQN